MSKSDADADTDTDSKPPPPTFEDHLGQVEGAIRRLETGDIPLEDSIDLYADAMQHLKACHAVLDAAEKRLEIVRKTAEGAPEATPADVDELEGGLFANARPD